MNKINKSRLIPADRLLNNLKKVVTGTGASRFFGLIRDISTTNLLGASIFHDIFVICLKIPNLFRRFFAEGAFNQAFIPIYSDYVKANQERDANEFVNSLAGVLINFLFIFTIIALIFAPANKTPQANTKIGISYFGAIRIAAIIRHKLKITGVNAGIENLL